jgi:hypothetical protein
MDDCLWLGFAHRFRPTYPGFPVEIGGVEQDHAAFFEKKPQTQSWLVLRSRKSGSGSVEMTRGGRCLQAEQLMDRSRFSSPWVGRSPMIPLSKNIPKTGPLNRRSLHCAPPDFLSRTVALIDFMRFPLRETAPEAVAGSAR